MRTNGDRATYTVTRSPADHRARAQMQTAATLRQCADLHGYITYLQRVAEDAATDPDTLAAIEEEMAALSVALAALMVDLPRMGRVQ